MKRLRLLTQLARLCPRATGPLAPTAELPSIVLTTAEARTLHSAAEASLTVFGPYRDEISPNGEPLPIERALMKLEMAFLLAGEEL